jgi:hypothetical protein
MDSSQTTDLLPYNVAANPIVSGHSWMICRYLLGAVLVTAAVLKAYELATLPLLGAGILNQRWLLAAVVEVEIVFGGWLLIGEGGRRTWACTGLLWLVFLGVAGYEAVTGAGSCGCFGRVHVNPWYTASFDLAVVLVLPFCRPRDGLRMSGGEWRLAAVGVIAITGAAFGIWDLYRYSPGRLRGDGLTFADGTVVLEPEKWVGQPFVLANYIDVGPQITRGDWIVLLYRYDCEHCQRAVPRYAALTDGPGRQSPTLPGIALVEIPPFAPAGQELVRPDMPVLPGRLTPDHDWFASTPVRVRVRDGTVTATAEGDAAEYPG